jgi:hypothetical protein
MTHQATWAQRADGLWLRIGDHADHVPPVVAQLLHEADAEPLTADAALDLLTAEWRLRKRIADTDAARADAHNRVARARATAAQLHRRHTLGGLLRRPAAARTLRTAIADQAPLVATLDHARADLAALRTFVTDLDAPSGPLRMAAEGWRRPPEPPTTVTTFTENRFLFTNPRRARSDRCGIQVIDGREAWGHQWRRDDDDDPYAQPFTSGTWTLGYLPRTGEIYAIRRADRRESTVWRLGTGFNDDHAEHLLRPLVARMREPNSLILAAHTVATAQPRPRPPANNDEPQNPGDGTHDSGRGAPNEPENTVTEASESTAHSGTLRTALNAVARHLGDHPDLALREITVRNPTATPAPHRAAGVNLVSKIGIDAVVQCDTIHDLLSWCASTTTHALTAHTPSSGIAELELVMHLAGCAVTIVTPAPELRDVLPTPANGQHPLTLTQLTTALEAAATVRHAQAADATVTPPAVA